jgi:hypothetical protein
LIRSEARHRNAFLNSLVNIDRNSLVAILSSEAEAARQLITAARSRTASQRAKRRDAEQHAARLDRMLLFFQHGDVVPGMSQRDIRLCKTVEQSLRAWGEPRDPPVPGLKP